MADVLRYEPASLTIGLRFKPSQAKVIAKLADQFEQTGQHDLVTLFRQASLHAKTGEPLLLEAESLEEARVTAAAFGLYPGVTVPTLEQLGR